MISVNAINYQASQLIDRALSGRESEHLRIILLEWATAFEMLLAVEGGKKGEAAALRLHERIESARSAILAAGTGSTRQAAFAGGSAQRCGPGAPITRDGPHGIAPGVPSASDKFRGRGLVPGRGRGGCRWLTLLAAVRSADSTASALSSCTVIQTGA